MGKKSPPKPPDLTPISNVQLQLGQEANELARQQLGLSRQQFDWFMSYAQQEIALAQQQADRNFSLQQRALASGEEAQRMATQVGQTQMEAMRQQMGYAAADRARYESVFLPMQDQYIAEAQAYDTPERREAEAARQMVDVQRQSEAQRANADARLRAMGVDPSQVRSTSLVAQMGVATAANQALMGNMGRQNIEDRGRAMREAAINMGNGLPAQSAMNYGGASNSGNSAIGAGQAGQQATMGGIMGSANLGAMGLSYRQNALNSAAALTGSPTQWAQLGMGSMGMAGNQFNNAANTLSQGYSNSLAGWQAGQQARQTGFSNVMGIASLGAGMFMAEGGSVDRALKFGGPEDMTPGDMYAPQTQSTGKTSRGALDRAREAFRKNKIQFHTAEPGKKLSFGDRMDNGRMALERFQQGRDSAMPVEAVRPQQHLQAIYSAEGGRAIPRRQSRDKIPAFLSEGEYVMPADVVQAIGLEKLDKLVAKYHRENA